jgi:hypothetical protein
VTVECSNCGDLGPEFWVTLVALLITVGGLVVAWRALGMTDREHREFMRRLEARARFNVTVATVNADGDGVLRTDGSHVGAARVSIGVKNVGEMAASQTLVNVVFPRGTRLQWSGAQGEDIGPERYPADTEDEVLRAPDGAEYTETQYLDSTWDRIGRRRTT